MVRLVPISAKKLIKMLQRLGFEEIRQKGSHKFFVHPITKKTATVPDHGSEDVSPGVLRTLLRDIELDSEEFDRLRK